MDFFYSLDILGTLAFAISGALVAIHKKLDPFGVFIVAFVTALGGGTLRDVLIGRNPVGWMTDLNYIYAIGIAVFLAIVFRKNWKQLSRSLFLFDTIGLGVFTIIGAEIGINSELHPIICIALGTMSASFGGVIRDILCNDIPVIFRKEIYATACIIGASAFILLSKIPLNSTVNSIITISIVILIRLIAVRYNLRLPTFYHHK